MKRFSIGATCVLVAALAMTSPALAAKPESDLALQISGAAFGPRCGAVVR